MRPRSIGNNPDRQIYLHITRCMTYTNLLSTFVSFLACFPAALLGNRSEEFASCSAPSFGRVHTAALLQDRFARHRVPVALPAKLGLHGSPVLQAVSSSLLAVSHLESAEALEPAPELAAAGDVQENAGPLVAAATATSKTSGVPPAVAEADGTYYVVVPKFTHERKSSIAANPAVERRRAVGTSPLESETVVASAPPVPAKGFDVTVKEVILGIMYFCCFLFVSWMIYNLTHRHIKPPQTLFPQPGSGDWSDELDPPLLSLPQSARLPPAPQAPRPVTPPDPIAMETSPAAPPTALAGTHSTRSCPDPMVAQPCAGVSVATLKGMDLRKMDSAVLHISSLGAMVLQAHVALPRCDVGMGGAWHSSRQGGLATPVIALRQVEPSSGAPGALVACCRAGGEVDGHKSFYVYDSADNLYGIVSRDVARRRCILSSSRLGQELLFEGHFNESVAITDRRGGHVGQTRSSAGTGSYELELAPQAQALESLVLCALICIEVDEVES